MKIRGFAVGSAPCCVPAAFTKDCVRAGHSASQACRKTHCRRPSECGGQMLCSIFLENRLVVQTLRPKSQHLGQWYLEVRREKFTSFTASLDLMSWRKSFAKPQSICMQPASWWLSLSALNGSTDKVRRRLGVWFPQSPTTCSAWHEQMYSVSDENTDSSARYSI